MYKIDLKKEDFCGDYLGVRFTYGEGETDSDYLAGRFKKKGFGVTAKEGYPLLTLAELGTLDDTDILAYANAFNVPLGSIKKRGKVVTKIIEFGVLAQAEDKELEKTEKLKEEIPSSLEVDELPDFLTGDAEEV